MSLVTIDKRFCGPPNSANGGYACGVLANALGGSAEVTLRAPPPLGRPLDLTRTAEGMAELRDGATLLGTARQVDLELTDIPTASFAEADDAARRSPYDESNHNLPFCFVCGPARPTGDGLRIFVGPLAATPGKIQTLAGRGCLIPTWPARTVGSQLNSCGQHWIVPPALRASRHASWE